MSPAVSKSIPYLSPKLEASRSWQQGISDMVDEAGCVWFLMSMLATFLLVLKKAISMALFCNPPPLSWLRNIAEPPPVSVPRNRDGDVVEDAALMAKDEGAEDRGAQGEMVRPKPLSIGMLTKAKIALKAKGRPPKIAIPESVCMPCFGEAGQEKGSIEKDIEIEEREYSVASRKGSRHQREDGYGAITNINGDYKQAFFGVFDGHGGRAAVDFVSVKLGKNIMTAVDELKEEEDHLDMAIKAGYLTTDKEFLSQGLSSGACAATVLLKDGELHVANVGDCRVVISRKGIAKALTSDQRAGREDERSRIEAAGGYVHCQNGIWRVQGSLAVSRAIGDANLKQWIISEPERKKLHLTPDCEFLVMASDGLWDKVSDQEAVDIILKNNNSMKSCKDLVEMSSRRGSRDDITVMVVGLQRFVQLGA